MVEHKSCKPIREAKLLQPFYFIVHFPIRTYLKILPNFLTENATKFTKQERYLIYVHTYVRDFKKRKSFWLMKFA